MSAFEELGSHRGFRPEPDGLDRKCPVCHAKPGEFCRNAITKEPRRGNVSCIGRVERSPRSTPTGGGVRGSTGESEAVSGQPSEEEQ